MKTVSPQPRMRPAQPERKVILVNMLTRNTPARRRANYANVTSLDRYRTGSPPPVPRPRQAPPEQPRPQGEETRQYAQTWQAYYEYAQQLYAAGYRDKAEMYHRQAQQLYAAANQPAGGPPTAAPPAGEPRSARTAHTQATAAKAQPEQSWQEYYHYAQQLYDAGEEEQAQRVYARAVALHSAEQSQEEMVDTAPAVQVSAAPANARRGEGAMASWARQATASELSYLDEPAARPKRKMRLRRKLAIYAVAILVVAVASFVALFHAYLKQRAEQDRSAAIPEAVQTKGVWDRIKDGLYDLTVQSPIGVLTPTFNKMVAVSDAAQPLLYELNLREPPPVSNWDPKSELPPVPSSAPAVASTEPAPPPQAPSAPETADGNQQQTARITIIPTSAGAADSDTGEPGPAPESKPEIHSQKPADHPQQSAHKPSRQKRRSRRDHSPEEPQPAPAEAPRQKHRAQERSRSASKESSLETMLDRTSDAFVPGANGRASDELDDLLSPDVKKYTGSRTVEEEVLPEKPTRANVQQVMGKVASQARTRCAKFAPATVQLRLVVNNRGKVTLAQSAAQHQNSPAGKCVAKIARRSRFARFSGASFTIKYPVRIQ